MADKVKIIECPRDAMQGIKTFIPVSEKVRYIQSLLGCGFDTIDFGSFVSPKAIPQMVRTGEVLSRLDLSRTKSKLLAIVANVRGAKEAAALDPIHYLGYPFSISENFQMRNTHKTIAQSVETLKEILEIAHAQDKEVVTYISMGFGNPYGDPWNVEIVGEWTEKLAAMGNAYTFPFRYHWIIDPGEYPISFFKLDSQVSRNRIRGPICIRLLPNGMKR